MKGLAGRALVLVATLLFGVTLAQAAPHPMDPLTAEEILGVASILLAGGAAQPSAIFQAIDLREPGKDAVLGFPGGGNPPRRATVFFRHSKKSYRSVVNLTTGTFTPPTEIPRTEGQLGLTFQEIADLIGCPLSTVKTRLYQGLTVLRRELARAPAQKKENRVI